jgi:hypothetical protein
LIIEYEVTIEDPTVWTRPWTAKQEFTKQSDEKNRICYEPRCIEGNFGLPRMLHGRRVEERAFAEGQGPNPRTIDHVGDVQSVRDDPDSTDVTEEGFVKSMRLAVGMR